MAIDVAKDFERLTNALNDAKVEVERQKAIYNSYLDRLKREFNINSYEDACAYAEQLKAEVAATEEKIIARIGRLNQALVDNGVI